VLVLVIDTSTPAVTAGVVDVASGVVLAARATVDARAHAEVLTPSIAAALAEAGIDRRDLTAVVAGAGPGPFTGLRVGLVTAAALADALRIPAYPVCSLDAIAAAAGPGRTLVASDARRREVYWASYAGGRRRSDPDVSRPGDLAGRLPELGCTAMAGAGAALYADVLGLPVVAPAYPPVGALAGLATARVLERAPPEALTPIYLRRPDAAPQAMR